MRNSDLNMIALKKWKFYLTIVEVIVKKKNSKSRSWEIHDFYISKWFDCEVFRFEKCW